MLRWIQVHIALLYALVPNARPRPPHRCRNEPLSDRWHRDATARYTIALDSLNQGVVGLCRSKLDRVRP